MKKSGLTQNQLRDAYIKEVRSLLELAVPVWSSGITLEQTVQIERVQKAALAAIVGPSVINYDHTLKKLNLDRLSTRREQICKKFIRKNMKSDKPLLKSSKKVHNTRSSPNCVDEINCRTQSFFTSSVPYLARLYNRNLKK